MIDINKESQTRRDPAMEKPIPFWKIPLDWRAISLSLSIVLGMGVVILGAVFGKVGYGILFMFSLVVFTSVVVGLPPKVPFATRAFRKIDQQSNQRGFVSDEAELGLVFGAEGSKRRLSRPMKRVGRMEIVPFFPEGSSEPIGICRDDFLETITGAIWLCSSSIMTSGSDELERRLNGFSRLLNMIGQRPDIFRFSWRTQILSGESSVISTSDPLMAMRVKEMAQDSLEVLTVMTLTIHLPSSKKAIKQYGSAERLLLGHLLDVHSFISGGEAQNSPMGVTASGINGYNDMVLMTRMALDPIYGQKYWQEWEPRSDDELLDQSFAWPKYSPDNGSPDYLRLGSTYHSGFYLADTPDFGLTIPEVWSAIGGKTPKSVYAVYQMIPRSSAIHRARWAASGARSVTNEELSRGRRVDASNARQEEETERHEREIVYGAGETGRLRVYFGLTAGSQEELEAVTDEFTSTVRRDSGLVIEPLTGQQLSIAEVMTPAGRGLAYIKPPKLLESL